MNNHSVPELLPAMKHLGFLSTYHFEDIEPPIILNVGDKINDVTIVDIWVTEFLPGDECTHSHPKSINANDRRWLHPKYSENIADYQICFDEEEILSKPGQIGILAEL